MATTQKAALLFREIIYKQNVTSLSLDAGLCESSFLLLYLVFYLILEYSTGTGSSH